MGEGINTHTHDIMNTDHIGFLYEPMKEKYLYTIIRYVYYTTVGKTVSQDIAFPSSTK